MATAGRKNSDAKDTKTGQFVADPKAKAATKAKKAAAKKARGVKPRKPKKGARTETGKLHGNSKSAKFTEREKRFLDHMDACGVASIAAYRAGYSEKSSKNLGAQVMARPHIRKELDKRSGKRCQRLSFDADTVLIRLATLANVSMSDFIDGDTGRLLETLQGVPEHALEGIQELTQTSYIDDNGIEHVTTKIKIVDQLKALQLAGKHRDVQAYLEKLEVGNTGFGDALARGLLVGKPS